jgi:hypothetical protein
MPEVVSGRAEWSPTEASHLTECADCAAEWRLVQLGFTLHADVELDTEPLLQTVLARLRAGGKVVAMPRLRWRHFALGLAAAASIALAVWVPSRARQNVVVMLPARIGPLLPSLSDATDEQLAGISLAGEGHLSAGVPGTVPHLGGLSAEDLEQLSSLTETP